MRRALISLCLGLAATLACASVSAADLSPVAGHYRYDEYRVTLPNGRELKLTDLGASDAYLDISESGSITLRMKMLAGNTVTETAQVLEARFAGPAGYWVAQWPDMAKPVRAEIRLQAGALISDTRFDDPSDPQRFGSIEHAVLRRVSER